MDSLDGDRARSGTKGLFARGLAGMLALATCSKLRAEPVDDTGGLMRRRGGSAGTRLTEGVVVRDSRWSRLAELDDAEPDDTE